MSRHVLHIDKTDYTFELIPQPTDKASVPLEYEVRAKGIVPFTVHFPSHLQTAFALLKEAYAARERL